MKERYNVAPWNDGKDAVCKAEDGKYILYTDHLAEIREIVDTYDLLIDRCDKKNSELEDERDGYRNGQQQVQNLLAKQIDNSLKLAAENKRLAALNDMFPQEIARLEDRVSEEYEAERADDRAKIEELKKENKRLRELVDGAQELEVERDAAVRWLEEYKSKTYCAYCGATFNIDSDASHVSEHIRTCPHHPMRELEEENTKLRAFWEWSRLADKMTFEQYHWIGKEASHE